MSSMITPEFQKLNNTGHLDRSSINEQLNVLENSLNEDIYNVDNRMQQIQEYILELKNQTNYLKALIAAEKDGGKRASLYRLVNNAFELIATFEGLLLKSLDVKHKYRQEFINSVHRKIKLFELELEASDGIGELNAVGLLKMVGLLQKSFDKFAESSNPNVSEDNKLTKEEKDMQNMIESINSNPSFSLR